jgi:hypothetical protein
MTYENLDPYNNDSAFRLGALVRSSNVIYELRKLPGKLSWDYSTRYDLMEYNIKLYGQEFGKTRIVDITFNIFDYDSSIKIYREEQTKDGRVQIPCDLTLRESMIIFEFLKNLIDEYAIQLKRKIRQNEPSDCVQAAFDLFSKDIVKVVYE